MSAETILGLGIILSIAVATTFYLRSVKKEEDVRQLLSQKPLVMVTHKKIVVTYPWETIGLFNSKLTKPDKFTYIMTIEAEINGVYLSTPVEVSAKEWNDAEEYDTVVNPLFVGPIVESLASA